MKKICNYIKENYICFVTAIVIGIALLILFIAKGILPFGNNSVMIGDGVDEFVPIMSLLRRNIIEHKSLVFSFDVGMGVGILGMFATYAASPFNLLLLLVSEQKLLSAIHFLWMLKIALCGFTMSYYLLHRNTCFDSETTDGQSIGKKTSISDKKNLIIFTVSILYALNNYIFAFANNIMWIDCVMWLPIIMLGLERMLNNGRSMLYIISLSICMISNYYISFEICIFLALYFIICKFDNIKDFSRKGIKFAVSSILAAGLSAFIIIPTYVQISNTASSGAGLPKPYFMGNMFNVFDRLLFATKPVSYSMCDYEANIYCSVFAIAAIYLYICISKENRGVAIRKVILLVFMLVSCNEEMLNFVWHGFHAQVMVPNRFTFLVIFIMLLIIYEVLCNLDKISMKELVAGLAIALLFVIICMIFSEEGISVISLVGSIAFLVIYFALIMCKKRFVRLDVAVIITVMIIVELTVHMTYVYRNFEMYDATDQFIECDEKNKMLASAKTVAKTEGFWRYEFAETTVIDEGMLRDVPSVSLFSSTISGKTSLALKEFDYDTNNVKYLYAPIDKSIDSILSVRYIIADKESETDVAYIRNEYKRVCEGDRYILYENPYYLPVGFAIPDKLSNTENVTGLCEEFEKGGLDIVNSLAITDMSDAYMEGEVELKEGQDIFFSIPYDRGINAYIDGEKTEIIAFADAFVLIKGEPGKHTVRIEYFPLGLKVGIAVSMICLIMIVAANIIIIKNKGKNDGKTSE